MAEVYEFPLSGKNSGHSKFEIINENDLDCKLQDDKVYNKKVIGIIGVERCTVMYESARLKRLTVSHKYQKKGIGSALLKEAIEFCEKRGTKQKVKILTVFE